MSETKNAIIDDMNIRRECACFYQTAGHTFYFIFDDGTVRSTRNVLSDPKTWRVIASYNSSCLHNTQQQRFRRKLQKHEDLRPSRKNHRFYP